MGVFDSQYAEHYDQFYESKDYGKECDLIEATASRYCKQWPVSLLDVGCGTGEHAIVLAKRGFNVTGVDLSNDMLEHARRKSLTFASKRPTWLCGDARTFDAGGTFDMAIMMFAVVGYLTGNDDVLAGLRNIRRHLNAGAVFACDFWYGPSVLHERPTDRVRVVQTRDGEVIRSATTALDVVHHTAEVSFRLWTIVNRQVVSYTTETHRLRYFFPQEFALLLSQSGFSLLSLSAFPSADAPLTDNAWNAYAVARAV